jgi:short-subunit dehydrogenase
VKKIAIVTGATSGIGYEITKELIIKNNLFVVAIGRNFEKSKFEIFSEKEILKLELDLKDVSNIENIIKNKILKNKNFEVKYLINNAGIGAFKPLEEFSTSEIINLVNINLTSHLLLSNLFLRELKKQNGTIININSIEAIKHSKFSAVYTATKSGLRNFGLSLFEEVRKSGVKVININPDITETNFFKNLNFKPADSQEAKLNAVTIAELISTVINLPNNTVINELTIRPQKVEIKKKPRIN